MKRLLIAGLAVIVGAVAFWSGRRAGTTSATSGARPDSVWYHASDVRLLATTGRPQLVEFFHPN